jgi:pimeloyl-ACP methyl ester carboxylesterase
MMRKVLIALILLFVVTPVLVAYVVPEDTAAFLVGLERSRAGLAYDSISINGEPWYFLGGGPEDGETLLLLHGFGGDKDNWIRFAGTLTDDFRVVIPDLPGFGETNRHWDWDYSAGSQAERVYAFVDLLGLERFHLAGHSMGGHIAGLMAHTNPDRIASLALITNSGVASPRQSYVAVRAAEGEMVLIPRTKEEFRRLIEVASYEPPFIPWPVGAVLAEEAIGQADFKAHLLDTLVNETGAMLEPVLPLLPMPVFVLWGRHDRLIDVSTVDVMRDLMPGATYVILEESGHLPILEQPALSADHYQRFLNGGRTAISE